MPSSKKAKEDSQFQANSLSIQSEHETYKFISFNDRIRLIRMVYLEEYQIFDVAEHLGIKISTAKYILKSFRKNGKILGKGLEGSSIPEQAKEEIKILENARRQKGSVRVRGKKLGKIQSNQSSLKQRADIGGQTMDKIQKIKAQEENIEVQRVQNWIEYAFYPIVWMPFNCEIDFTTFLGLSRCFNQKQEQIKIQEQPDI